MIYSQQSNDEEKYNQVKNMLEAAKVLFDQLRPDQKTRLLDEVIKQAGWDSLIEAIQMYVLHRQ